MADEEIAEPTKQAKQLRFEVLVAIAGDCLRERDRLVQEAERIAQRFWSEEQAHFRTTGKRFKYTPKLALRAWAITLAWQRKSSTIYGRKGGKGGRVGPKWQYLKRGKKKRYSMGQFTAYNLSDREREAINVAETEFALLRAQGELFAEIGFKITLDAKRLGFKLQDYITATGEITEQEQESDD